MGSDSGMNLSLCMKLGLTGSRAWNEPNKMRQPTYKVWDKREKRFWTKEEWSKHKEIGWFYDFYEGKIKQVLTTVPYTERICKEVTLV
jgi:hypothetical protein